MRPATNNMRILAFVDVHANKQALAILKERSKQADLLLCAGDISVFGMELLEVLSEMNSWNKPICLIHGNHEDEDSLTEVNEHFPNIFFVHKQEKAFGDLLIWGYGGGGFATKDPELERYAKQFKPNPRRIMLFHGPPFGTVTDFKGENEGHVGCQSRRKVIEQLKPVIAIVGHIHETFGSHEKLGNSVLMNPGPIGKFINLIDTPTAKAKKQTKPALAKKGEKPKKKAKR